MTDPTPSRGRSRSLAAACAAVAAVALGVTLWMLVVHGDYRIDVDVYRMGARAWLDGDPLYGDVSFRTAGGLELPFTYPPLAAVLFSPLAALSGAAASAAITVATVAALLATVAVVCARLDLRLPPGRLAAAGVVAAVVVPTLWWVEPVRANLEFGQVNALLMALVVADCVPRRTPWPRGMLVGLAIAVKLTPAVFLLYFVLRRDVRAAVVAGVSFAAATALGALAAWSDTLAYWTSTVSDTGRIGSAALNTNQNLAGVLARLGLGDTVRPVLWIALDCAALAVTVWAGHRLVRAGRPTAALLTVALFGLVVSPVSWSHHWVWVVPVVIVAAVEGVRGRDGALLGVAVIGAALTVWAPLELLPAHHETDASWWRQLLGAGYLWWALATVAVWGASARRSGSGAADDDDDDDDDDEAAPRRAVIAS